MKIVWTNSAITDLQAIRDYVAKNSEYYAAGLIGKIIQKVDQLGASPEWGQVVPEFKNNNLREKIYRNYRIIYRVKSTHLEILAIIHASRDFSALEFPFNPQAK